MALHGGNLSELARSSVQTVILVSASSAAMNGMGTLPPVTPIFAQSTKTGPLSKTQMSESVFARYARLGLRRSVAATK